MYNIIGSSLPPNN